MPALGELFDHKWINKMHPDPKDHRDRKLCRALNCRIPHCQLDYRNHIKRQELTVAVRHALQQIKSDTENYSEFGLEKIEQIRNHQILMKCNNSVTPLKCNTDKYPPYHRTINYIDFAVKFDTTKFVTVHQPTNENINVTPSLSQEYDQQQIIEWFEESFKEAFVEKLSDYYGDFPNFSTDQGAEQNSFLININPTSSKSETKFDYAFGHNLGKAGTADHFTEKAKRSNKEEEREWLFLKKNVEHTFMVLHEDNRKILRETQPGIYRANVCIPDGVFIIHLDKGVWMDEKMQNMGFGQFGIRIWPCRPLVVGVS